jgi:hypothetical protein
MANWAQLHLASRNGFKSTLASKQIKILQGVKRQMREREREIWRLNILNLRWECTTKELTLGAAKAAIRSRALTLKPAISAAVMLAIAPASCCSPFPLLLLKFKILHLKSSSHQKTLQQSIFSGKKATSLNTERWGREKEEPCKTHTEQNPTTDKLRTHLQKEEKKTNISSICRECLQIHL